LSLDGLAAVMSRNMRQGQPMLNSMAEEEHEDGDGGIDEVLLRALSRVATVTNKHVPSLPSLCCSF